MAKSLQIEKFSCLADYLVLFEVCAVCAVCVCVFVGVLNVDFCPLIAKSTRPLWSTKFRELRTV